MFLTRFIPIRYFIFLILGIFLGYQLNMDEPYGFRISVICLIILGLIHFRAKRTRDLSFEIITAICLIGIGISAVTLNSEPEQPDHYSRFKNKDAVIRLQLQEELRSGTYNNRFIARILAVDDTFTSGKILLYTTDSITFPPDTELLVIKTLQPIRPPTNPGQFDYRSYMALQGIYDEIRLSRNDHIVLQGAHQTLMGRLRILKQNIGKRLLEVGLSPATVATTEALLLGQRQHMDTDLYNSYKDAGAVHILAVSGLHIGILVLILKFVLQPLRRIRKGDLLQILIIVALLWGYALFTGMSPSVVRAVALFSFISYAWLIRRPTNMYNSLALSFFFILLVIKPVYLFQAGFQMSYAAVLAIIWIYPMLMNLWRPEPWMLKRVWQLLAVSVSAQLGVLPISLYYFHQFPGLFFISNLLILPVLGIVLVMGIVLMVSTQLGWNVNLLSTGYDTLIQTMNQVVQWIGSQELFIFRDVEFDLPMLVLLYGLIITLVLFLQRRKFKWIVVLAGIVLLFQSWVGVRSWKQQTSDSLYVLHAVKHSLLLEQRGIALRLFSDSSETRHERLLQDYQMAAGKGYISQEILQNSYQWKDQHILIVDASGVIPETEKEVTHILLAQSPRIHLDRLLKTHPSAVIIADGSNFPSFVKRWRESCKRLKRPYHYTGYDGAYRFQGK